MAAGIGFIVIGLMLLLFARSIYLFNAQLNQSTELGRWLYQYKDDPEGPSMVIRAAGMILSAFGIAILLFPR